MRIHSVSPTTLNKQQPVQNEIPIYGVAPPLTYYHLFCYNDLDAIFREVKYLIRIPGGPLL